MAQSTFHSATEHLHVFHRLTVPTNHRGKPLWFRGPFVCDLCTRYMLPCVLACHGEYTDAAGEEGPLMETMQDI